jgi:hypothetical protein
VIKRVADSLKHRRFRASNKGLGEARAKRARRSVDIFAFLGSTGTGKTELAEAIAEVYYGHRSRAVRFDIGSIKNGDQLNDIFGSPRGYVGSNTRPPFEEALVTFGHEGGVIIFDEFDKIGGGAKSGIPSSARDQFLNGLYSITDKAEWRSPLGKVYDLSHVIFVFTANAGQELTQGLPTDDLRLSAWESANDEQSLEAILRESGWQEALVGRLRGSMFLFKPLTQTYKDDIAKKEIDRVLEDFGSTIGLDDVAFHPNFLKILNDAFFSHSSGARSMNLMIKKTIPALLTEVLSSDVDLTSGRDIKFRFTLSDNYHGVYSFSGARPPKRSVLLTLDLIKADGAESAFTRDVSHFANKKVLRSVQDMRRTAFHEAGHVVANDATLTNKGFDFVTIVGAGDFLGYARFKSLDHVGPLSRDAIVASVASLLAGRAAEMMMGFSPDAGWSSDWEQARLTAVTAIKKYGLVDDPLSLRFDADGAIIMNDPKVQSAIEAILTDAQDFALKRLKAQWPAVHMLAMRLLQKYSISRDEIDSILAYAGSDKHRIDLGNAAKAQIPQPRLTLNHSCSSAFKTRKLMD